MDPSNAMREMARGAAEAARTSGAQGAAVSAERVRTVEVQWRDGRLEQVKEATTRALKLELYVDGRYSQVATSDLRPEAVKAFVAGAVTQARNLEKDPFRSLPDPKLYEGQARATLDLEDPGQGSIAVPARKERAQAIEAGARSVPGAASILSITVNVQDVLAETFRVHTDGFEGTRRATTFQEYAEVSVKDPDGRRPAEYDYAVARHRSAMPDPAALGRSAASRALGRVGARKGASAATRMVVDARAAGRLFATLVAPLSGMSLQQKESCLEGKLGQGVGSALLDLSDDPLLPRGLASRHFDAEGLAARRFPVFEKGVLRAFYVDTYYGKKLGMAPTTRGTSNLAWSTGTRDRAGLVADAREGYLVTGFIGGNSNSTTGDFSLGIQGNRIRGGAVAEPVSEMNVSGNLLDVWTRLVAVGNDPFPSSPLRTPTLVFDGIQFAGA